MMNGIKKHLWAIIFALVGQTMAAVWWASAINTRMGYVERDLDRCGDRVHSLEVSRRNTDN